jgi:hypothetical protein
MPEARCFYPPPEDTTTVGRLSQIVWPFAPAQLQNSGWHDFLTKRDPPPLSDAHSYQAYTFHLPLIKKAYNRNDHPQATERKHIL